MQPIPTIGHFRITLAGCLLALASLMVGCSAAQTPPGSPRIASERSYVLIPAPFAEDDDVRTSGAQLINCYESTQVDGPEQVTHVELQLIWTGASLHARVVQIDTLLAPRLQRCVDDVVASWELDGALAADQTIVPVEFGPLE